MEKAKEYLGKMGRDKVTGFVGVIVAFSEHLYGCDTLTLKPKVNKDGKLEDGCTFDIGRVEVLAEAPAINTEDVASPDGKRGGDTLPERERW